MEKPFDIVIDENTGQAKGVNMTKPNETINIKEVVGITKTQLFLIVLFAILLGAAAFALGYFFSQDKELAAISKQAILNQLDQRYNIGLNRGYHQNAPITTLPSQESTETNANTKSYIKQESKIYNQNKENANQDLFNINPTQKFYILIGKYSKIEDAERIQNKTQLMAGQMATITQTADGFLVVVGPFESESLARNEKELIYHKSNVKGSIINDI